MLVDGLAHRALLFQLRQLRGRQCVGFVEELSSLVPLIDGFYEEKCGDTVYD